MQSFQKAYFKLSQIETLPVHGTLKDEEVPETKDYQ